MSKINGSQLLLDRVICSNSLKSSTYGIRIDKQHRKSDHMCVISSWNVNVATSEVGSPKTEGSRISVYRTMKNKHAIKSYSEKVNNKCKILQLLNLSSNQIFYQTIKCLE